MPKSVQSVKRVQIKPGREGVRSVRVTTQSPRLARDVQGQNRRGLGPKF